MSLPITPETKVGALLEAYPGIEDLLISWVPAFQKLKNPVLRKTVTKIVSLQQAAGVAGISVKDLVQKLRAATGQTGSDAAGSGTQDGAGERPEWLEMPRVIAEIHADTLLEAGEHPIGKVRKFLAEAPPGSLLRLVSSFRPAPLIDAMSRGGAAVYCEPGEGGFNTYFRAGVTPSAAGTPSGTAS